MTMDQRNHEELLVVSTGVQDFENRFGAQRRWGHDTPAVSIWRCNLTGLSQVHNLYFIAYGQDIYVYEPQFPTQAVPEEPVLVFTSQPSSQGLRGSIAPRRPHSINNLVVQFLGKEEVVAVVRDDGDVDVFLVRHVLQAVEHRAEPGNSLSLNAHEIKPFFQSNVEISAWGLAIHAEARILATSSNKHEVRIFKFGLLQSDEEGEKDDVAMHDDGEQAATHRKTDVFRHIINGQSNIPYISFCNTGDDPDGRWLLTTDISGVCRVMNLHKLESVQSFRFGRSFATSQNDGFDRLNSGWSIMFVDRRSFRQAESPASALGFSEGSTFKENSHAAGDVLDISDGIQRHPGASEPFMHHVRGERRRAARGLHVRDVPEDSILSNTGTFSGAWLADGDEEMDEGEDSDSSNGGVEIEIEVPADESESEDSIHDSHHAVPGTHAVSTAFDGNAQPVLRAAETGVSIEDAVQDFDAPAAFIDDDADSSPDELNPSHRTWYNGESVLSNKPIFSHNNGTLCDDLPCPILHTSPRNIYLIQPSNQCYGPGPFNPPMIGLASPLRQAIHLDFAHIRDFDRLNMTASIPALGVVVVASQKGRAAVMALTKFERRFRGQMPREKSRSVYGMRVQAILPFVDQEKANQRPSMPLYGIAVSPVQGSSPQSGLDRGDGTWAAGSDAVRGNQVTSSRWRLMMMYYDHTILSYEISLGIKGGSAGVEVEKLVV